MQRSTHYKYTSLREGAVDVSMVSFRVAAPRTVSERTQSRYVMPLAQELASSDPVPRRSGSPPQFSARGLETNKIGTYRLSGRSRRR